MKTPIVGPYSVNDRLAAHNNAITELASELKRIPQGPAGRDGKDAEPHFCQSALDEVHRLRAALDLLRTEFKALEQMYRDLVARDKHTSEYLEYLRAKRTKVQK